MNNQQLLFIQGLFNYQPFENFGKTIMIEVTEKHEAITFKIEVSANTKGRFVAYRVHTATGEGQWNTWEDEDHVANWFRMASLL
jgi:hypothetical protein